MVVDEDDRGRPLRDRLPKHFARVNEGRIKNTTRDRYVTLQPVLRVEDGHVKLFDGEILEPVSEDRDDILRRTDRGRLVPRFSRHTSAQLEGRVDHDRLG